MNNYLKTYKIILTVQSPVFIGDGKKIGKKEYIFDYRNSMVYVPDFDKMFDYMYKKNLLLKYQDYMLKEDRLDLAGWLKNNNILSKDYMSWISYSMSSGDAVFDNKSKKEIDSFVKDVYGKPYIPGSSLKGAIRTVLLADNIMKNRAKYSVSNSKVMNGNLAVPRNRLLTDEMKEIEQQRFYTLNRKDKNDRPVPKSNAVNDVMSGLRISDSKPLDTSSLVLCQKVDENTSGIERKMPLLRECLKPGTTVEFDLTIDTTICPFDKDDIMAAINSFAQNNLNCFDMSFKSNGTQKKDSILIGGGTGYQTKTVTYPLLGKSPQTVDRISKIIEATLGKDAKEKQGI